MKRMRILLSLLLITVLLLAVMPVAFAGECSKSPDGNHHWELDGYGPITDVDPCTWEFMRYDRCKYCYTRKSTLMTRYFHKWGDWVVVKEATCTEPGLWARTCYGACGKVETESRLADHSYGPWTVVTEPTDHSAGARTHSCSVCGHEEQEFYDPEGTLRRGDKGSGVYTLQSLLIARGYLPPRTADGDFGEGTESAIRVFQQDAGLTVDGVAWPQTIKMLDPNVVITKAAAGCVSSVRMAEDGGLELVMNFCEEHASLISASAKLTSQAKRLLWSSSLEEAYDTLLGKQAEDALAAVEKEREAFQAWLAAYESYLQALYPDGAEMADNQLAQHLMRHCAVLCWLSHPDEPLMELPAVNTDDGSPAPACCQLEGRTEENSLILSIDMCDEHRVVADAASIIPGKQAKDLWLLTQTTLIASQAEESEESKAEQAAFTAWLEAFEALVKQLRPDLTDAPAQLAAEALMEHVAIRCSLQRAPEAAAPQE